ncbi:hypothetical protein LMH87_007399 [Akanthomyces muscarius]|uniref:Uncharacterized protein n=1 Tax=Akanthomyces muscarius TaxID=2231603 RepID=A0A9W8QPL5_AKAMU|nr:hypothetical protein LMH87_007399 [Akanthomyces muscarius]KAJ4165781.1 hypothetical protein LMH87_007399 [Akanthomyces muscarius]
MDNAAVPFSEVKARASIQRRRLPLSRKSLLKFPSGLIPIYLQAQQKWIGLRIKRPTSHIQQSIQNIISYMHNIRLLKLVCLAARQRLWSHHGTFAKTLISCGQYNEPHKRDIDV